MANQIKWNHDVLEQALDDFAEEALRKAEKVKATADSMRTRPGIAPYNVNLRKGRKGGRRYAVVSADAPSTVANEARTNALNKAAGSCLT